ncbi:MAG: hypothetical protein RLZZ385_1382 [Pseudomonadota bacterium]
MSAEPDFSSIRIVLVNTSHPGNIGAAARAMKNMGLANLWLVQPQQFPSGVAVGRAASALNILDQAVVCNSLQEAVADCGLIIGTSARSRSIPLKLVMPEESAELVHKSSRSNRVALVFGREDSGLTNEELQLCHYHVQIPASSDYSSLNLAAAVMVICYELRRRFLRDSATRNAAEEDYWDLEMATGEQVEHFFEHLEKVLVRIEFHDPDNPRQLMQRLRRLFGRIRLDTMEMNILRGILSHVEYHLDHPSPAALAGGETDAGQSPARKQPAKTKKDFAQAALKKRNLEVMASILEQASKKP